jgi:hypothetical protein
VSFSSATATGDSGKWSFRSHKPSPCRIRLPGLRDSNVIAGVRGLAEWPVRGLSICGTVASGFFPELPKARSTSSICSRKQPGRWLHAQLKTFVDYARAHKAVIIFDSAYAAIFPILLYRGLL